MLAQKIKKGLEFAKKYRYPEPQPANRFDFYEAQLTPLLPTSSAISFLTGRTMLKYSIGFPPNISSGIYTNTSWV